MKNLVILGVSLISATAAMAQTPTPAPTPAPVMVAGGVYVTNAFAQGSQGYVSFQVVQTTPSLTLTTACLKPGEGAGLYPTIVTNDQATSFVVNSAVCTYDSKTGQLVPGQYSFTGAQVSEGTSLAYPMLHYAYPVTCDNLTSCKITPTQASPQSRKPAGLPKSHLR